MKRTTWLSGIILGHIVYFLIAYATAASPMIEVMRAMLMAMSFGVTIAFGAVMWMIVKQPSLERGDTLTIGIFFKWLSTFIQSSWSLWWRMSGSPPAGANTDFITWFLFLAMIGAVFHMVRPDEISNKVPTAQWIKIGLWCGGGLMILLVIFVWDWGLLAQGSPQILTSQTLVP
jgi:hypothetical protein